VREWIVVTSEIGHPRHPSILGLISETEEMSLIGVLVIWHSFAILIMTPVSFFQVTTLWSGNGMRFRTAYTARNRYVYRMIAKYRHLELFSVLLRDGARDLYTF